MLSLNLVSQELKKEIKLKHIFSLFKKMNLVLIIISIVVAIILLAAKIILQNNFNQVVEQTTLVALNSRANMGRVREINSQIKSASLIQRDHIPWSFLLEIISKNTPEGISYSRLQINKKTQTININGNAKLRDDLIQLKDNYVNSKIFYDIESPIENLLKKENINFELTIKLNLKELTKVINSI